MDHEENNTITVDMIFSIKTPDGNSKFAHQLTFFHHCDQLFVADLFHKKLIQLMNECDGDSIDVNGTVLDAQNEIDYYLVFNRTNQQIIAITAEEFINRFCE
jgi:hypothetical protein